MNISNHVTHSQPPTGAAVRTPITKARKGGLKDACPEDLLSHVFKAVIQRSGVDPALVEDVAVGNVLPPGGGAVSPGWTLWPDAHPVADASPPYTLVDSNRRPLHEWLLSTQASP